MADDRVANLTALDSSGKRTLYKNEWAEEPDGFLTTVADHDLLIEDATGTDDRWWFRLRGPDRENLAAFQQSLLDEGISLYIHRIWNPTVPEPNQYDLTEKQREALQLAFRDGFFDTPRKTSMEDLGEQLDISHQSVSQRLRNGLSYHMISDVADQSEMLQRHLEILTHVLTQEPIGIVQLSNEIGYDHHEVRYSLRRLEEESVIEPSPQGARTTEQTPTIIEGFGDELGDLQQRISAMRFDP